MLEGCTEVCLMGSAAQDPCYHSQGIKLSLKIRFIAVILSPQCHPAVLELSTSKRSPAPSSLDLLFRNLQSLMRCPWVFSRLNIPCFLAFPHKEICTSHFIIFVALCCLTLLGLGLSCTVELRTGPSTSDAAPPLLRRERPPPLPCLVGFWMQCRIKGLHERQFTSICSCASVFFELK